MPSMKTLQSPPKCRGRGPLLQYRCLLNLMAVMLRLPMQAIIPASIRLFRHQFPSHILQIFQCPFQPIIPRHRATKPDKVAVFLLAGRKQRPRSDDASFIFKP